MSYRGCSHGVCLFIHQCFVNWDKYSSVIWVVERQNKEHEFTEKEDLFEHEKISPGNVGCFCLLKCTNVHFWNAGTRLGREEEYMLALSRDSSAAFGFLHSAIRMAVHTSRLPTELP